MYDLRPILLVNGVLLAALGVAMLVPALVDAFAGNSDWQVFLTAAGVSVFIGGGLVIMNRSGPGGGMTHLSVPQAFLLTTSVWVSLTAFSALPLVFTNLGLSYTDAFFEAMSGITTTGATVIVGLDDAPPGILLWRSILQWLGGIGIIVMAIAVLPMLQIGGMQLFRLESSDTSEKILPRAAQIASGLTYFYIGFTLLVFVSYWIAGMTSFDALNHAMTTVATGGFSTHDASIGYFDATHIEWVVIFFMILGGMPFLLFIAALRGKAGMLFRDDQVRLFLVIIILTTAAMTIWHLHGKTVPGEHAVRASVFAVVTNLTGTGYGAEDYSAWGPFGSALVLLMMFIGGCAGSAACGIKIFRVKVLLELIKVEIRKVLHPHGVFVPRYNKRPISEDVLSSVGSFIFLYIAIFVGIALALAAIGLDFETALSGAATSLSNVGPGLGPVIGPSSTFASLPDAAKWILSGAMLLGRLELVTVLVLFSRRFWRN